MLRDEIRAAMSDALHSAGFRPETYRWVNRPATLELLVGSVIQIIPCRTRMTRAQLQYQLGRIAAYGEQRPARLVRAARFPAQLDIEDSIAAAGGQ